MFQPFISRPPVRARLVRVRWVNSTWRPRVSFLPRYHRMAKLGVRPARVIYRSLAVRFTANGTANSHRPHPSHGGLIRLRRVLGVNGASHHPRNGVTRHLHVRIIPSPELRSPL